MASSVPIWSVVTAAVSVNVVNSASVGSMPAVFNFIYVLVNSSIPNWVLVANFDISLNASAPALTDPVTDVRVVRKSSNLAVVATMPLNANAVAPTAANALRPTPSPAELFFMPVTPLVLVAKLRSNFEVSSSRNTFIFLAIIVSQPYC